MLLSAVLRLHFQFLPILIVTIVSIVAQGANAQDTLQVAPLSEIPDTPLGAHVRELLEAFNSGDITQLETFTDSHFQPTALKQRRGALAVASYWAGVYKETGPLTLFSIERVSLGGREREIAWFYANRTRRWIGIGLRLEEEEPYQLVGHSVIRGLLPSNRPTPDYPGDTIAEYLDEYLTSLSEHDHFSGAVLLARGDDLLFEGAYGYSDREANNPLTLESRFRLASATKMFTGIAIAQLAEQGKLNFDDPISKYIPEYPKHIADKVTIHQLLTHQSGIELDNYSRYNREIQKAESIDDLLQTQLKYLEHLNGDNYENFEPLGSYDYTNEGIDLLGVIIERVSGQSWSRYLKKNIFKKAGMKNTGAEVVKGNPGLVTRYTATSRVGTPLADRRPLEDNVDIGKIRPAGSGWSTVGDLYLFVRALRSNQLLSPEMTQVVTSPKVTTIETGNSNTTREYGYTFDVITRDDVQEIGHRGGAPGISTAVRYYPQQGWTVIVLSNYDRAGDVVLSHIEELIAATER